MRGVLVGLFISLAAVAFGATSAFAECPDGKEPVNISTPSGITKTLCIPAAAVKGIETAAENSAGTIVTAECPCWTSSEINDLANRYPEFYCRDLVNSIRCDYDPSYERTSNYALALKIEGDYYTYSLCGNQDSGVIVEYLTQEEVGGCASLVESYIVISDPPTTK